MLTPSEMKDRMQELAKQEGYIDGIFNYCDRWCERCAFTSQCRNYAFGEKAPPPEGPEFWDYIHNVFEATMLMLQESMEKMGIDPAGVARETPEEYDPKDHPLHKKVYELSFDMHKWLENIKPGNRPANGDEIIASVADKNQRLSDALDVIYYYNFFISAKIYRALFGDDDFGPDEIQTDSNGSAKIALIALDRLIVSWSILLENMMEREDEILKFLIALADVRNMTEAAFPLARQFRRPGFDTQ